MAGSMVFCRGCGKEIHESALICPLCGAPERKRSEKSKVVAGVLALLLGGIGIHKFYVGAWGWGIVYIIFVWTWIPALFAIIEGIRYLTLSDEDFSNKVSELNGAFAFLW